jgi:methylisocitrate lyase
MAERVEAMCAHRLNPDFVIIARTDARHVTGFEDAVARANAYRQAGADMIFPEGLQSVEEFARFAKESPGPLLANMTEFGKTPDINVSQFQQLGYHVVIYPLSVMRVAMGHVTTALHALKRDGSMKAVISSMQTRKELYELLGYTPGAQWNFPHGHDGSTAH